MSVSVTLDWYWGTVGCRSDVHPFGADSLNCIVHHLPPSTHPHTPPFFTPKPTSLKLPVSILFSLYYLLATHPHTDAFQARGLWRQGA